MWSAAISVIWRALLLGQLLLECASASSSQAHELSLQGAGGGRALARAGGKVEVTPVHTPQEFVDAIVAGAADIEIRAHLDMTGTESLDAGRELGCPLPGNACLTVLSTLAATTRSIRGNCKDPPSEAELGLEGAPLLPLIPNQCVIVTDLTLLTTFLPPIVWIDGLYMRSKRTERSSLYEFGMFTSLSSNAYYTYITTQGEGQGSDLTCGFCGLYVGGVANVYAEDCRFADHNGRSIIGGVRRGAANLVDCTFDTNSVQQALFRAERFDNGTGPVFALEDYTFSGNSFPNDPLLATAQTANDDPVFYADPPLMVLEEGCDDCDPPIESRSVQTEPLSDFPADRRLSRKDAAFVELRKMLPKIPRKSKGKPGKGKGFGRSKGLKGFGKKFEGFGRGKGFKGFRRGFHP